jgi:hypothetical protein
MAKEKLPPLTDEQIRIAITELNNTVMRYGATTAALETLLLQKKLVTESEVQAATDKIYREGKEANRKDCGCQSSRTHWRDSVGG